MALRYRMSLVMERWIFRASRLSDGCRAPPSDKRGTAG